MTSRNMIRQESKELAPRGLPWSFDRLFDRWWNEFGTTPWNAFGQRGASPCLDVCEDDKQVVVSAELPGMDEKDIQVTLGKDRMILQGDKKEDTREEGKDFLRHERAFGSIYREVALPAEVDVEKAQAEFKRGILTLMLPKSEEARKGMRKVPIKAAA